MRPIDADALIAELESCAEACHRDFNRAKHKVEKDMLMEAHVGYIKLIGMVKAMPTVDLETDIGRSCSSQAIRIYEVKNEQTRNLKKCKTDKANIKGMCRE